MNRNFPCRAGCGANCTRGVTELPRETQGKSLVSFVQMVYQSSQPEIFALWGNPLADRRGRLSLRGKIDACVGGRRLDAPRISRNVNLINKPVGALHEAPVNFVQVEIDLQSRRGAYHAPVDFAETCFGRAMHAPTREIQSVRRFPTI